MSRLSLRERMLRMNQRSLFHTRAQAGSDPAATAPEIAEEELSAANSARGEAVQRLQVGLFGIGAMVLLVGLASIIGGQADRNDQLAVPEAAPTTEPGGQAAQANPLADAGVVPDIAAEPSPSPAAKTLDLPAQGRAAGNVAPAR